MADLTAPPSYNPNSFDELWFFLIPAIIIVLSIAIIFYFVDKKKKKQNTLTKKAPVIFKNQANNDITLLALESYQEIIVKVKLYENNLLKKEFTIKELDFKENEQRTILKSKDFDNYQIDYSIQSYK